MSEMSQQLENVKDYYSKTLKSKRDLKSTACTSDDFRQLRYRKILGELEVEILEKYYGCGSHVPSAIEGCTVLDLGCGTGRDSYVMSKLVGPKGRVIGVDMTPEQIDVANRYLDTQMKKFNYPTANTEFHVGYIEDLQSLGIQDESVDVVISNCVINLSLDKKSVFSEIFRVLKPGGELFFSDVFTGRRVPEDLIHDPVLHGECLSGAMYIEDFRRLLVELGYPDYRVLAKKNSDLLDPEIEAKIGMIDFYAYAIRAFKLSNLEDQCEDYGQIARYKGSIDDFPHGFELDDHHYFPTGKPVLVCGNTAAMLQDTRYGKHFEIIGDRSQHFGLFDCSPEVGIAGSNPSSSSSTCC